MNKIGSKIRELQNEAGADIQIVAVSKTKPVSVIKEAYETGQRIFGENKVQELQVKQPELPADIEWHMIGHLQTNKVKYIAPYVSMIHSVDRMKLLRTINKEAAKNKRVIPCLLEFHIAEEESKFGLDMMEAKQILESDAYSEMKNIQIAGVMGMATFTTDVEKIREEFALLRNIYQQLKTSYFQHDAAFKEISMGMTNDYKIAIEEGSTMLRLGSLIFGARE